jgi:hypothetical protein
MIVLQYRFSTFLQDTPSEGIHPGTTLGHTVVEIPANQNVPTLEKRVTQTVEKALTAVHIARMKQGAAEKKRHQSVYEANNDENDKEYLDESR